MDLVDGDKGQMREVFQAGILDTGIGDRRGRRGHDLRRMEWRQAAPRRQSVEIGQSAFSGGQRCPIDDRMAALDSETDPRPGLGGGHEWQAVAAVGEGIAHMLVGIDATDVKTLRW